MKLRASAITLAALAVACTKEPVSPKPVGPQPPPPITALPRALTSQEQSLIAADNRFAIKLLKQANADTRDTLPNLFVSPLSVAMALGMTYNGAAGTTEDAMRTTLELDGMSVAEVNDSYRSLIELLRELDPHVQFTIANSIWYKQGYTVEQPFLDVNRDYYDARVSATRGLIPTIINQIPDYMRLYLIDAIYFKGDWTERFDPTLTQARPFHLGDGSTVTVPTMTHTQAPHIRVTWRPYAAIIDLPYGGQAFSMTIVLPHDTTNVDNLLNGLTAEQWNGWTSTLQPSVNEVFLPKFKLTNDLALIPSLSALGMGIAFGSQADFTRIHAPSELSITEVKHKTYVDVNEEGTTAAAVTSVGVGVVSVPTVFEINRPFLFALRENLSGTILFMGVIRHPTTE